MTKDEQDARQTDLYLGRVEPAPGDMFEAFVAERGRKALAQNEMRQAPALELSAEEQETLAAIVAPFEAVMPKHRRGPKQPPMLKFNERVRLAPGGTLYRVVRVNACAAYLKPIHSTPKLVEFVTPGGHNHTFLATEGSNIIAVSPFSFVYREA